jgi:hypothetical protein
MGYVDQLLANGETVIRREKQHWILPFYIAGRWVAIALAIGVVGVVLNLWIIPSGGDGLIGSLVGVVNTLVTLATSIALLIAVVGFGVAIALWRSQEYVLTNQRVIHVRGLVSKQSSDSALESLTDARIVVPWLGKLMGWGDLYLMTASASGDEHLRALLDPIGFKKAVMGAKTERTMALNAGARAQPAQVPVVAPAPVTAPAAPAPVAPAPAAPAAPAPAAMSADDVTRTLTALAGLRDSGAITPEDYEAKKRELLDRI